MQKKLKTVHTGDDRGVKQAGFMVLTTARRPAILVELGYSTNPQDGRYLTSRRSQRTMAAAIADAIVEYLKDYERKTGGAERRRGGPVRTTRALSAVLVAALLGGCVYYNGMYNTKRLAGSARKAERDGRTFEANNLWGQVVTRAESLVARHPDSKYVDEALVLKGIALARLNQCEAAVAPLGRVSLLPPDAEVTEEAALALGRCQLELGDPGVAEIMFARVAESKDPVRRREARLLRGRALRMTGRHQEAVAALEGSVGPARLG